MANLMTAAMRMCLTADRERLVPAGSEEAAFLYASVGDDIPESAVERFGLVHADLRLANLLVEDEKVNVIDFDDCGYSWFMYDFGTAVSFIDRTTLRGIRLSCATPRRHTTHNGRSSGTS